jgi:hypothetical protein
MESARPDRDWEIRYKQFEAITSWNDDGTANINLPIEFATIRNKLADALVQKQVVKFTPTEESDIDKVGIAKALWDFVWEEADTDKELFDHYLMAYIFGTSIWYEGMHKECFTRYVSKIGKDGLVESEAKTTTKSWLKGYAVDIRDFYIDPVHDIELAEDCFHLEILVNRC